MTTWSTRIGVLLLSSACAAGLASVPALGQVSAANTIAPDNTVVGQPKATVAPTPTGAVTPSTTAKAKAKSTPTTLVISPVAGSLSATAALGVAPIAPPPVEAQSFSDPLADLAAAALNELPGGPSGAGAVTAGTTTADGLIPAPVAAPAVQFAFTQSTVPVDPNTPRPPSTDGASSVIINTGDLGEFALGTPVASTVSQESQKILAGLPTGSADRYLALLRAIANVVGPRTKTAPTALEAVWVRTDGRRMKAILTAMAQVGTRYRYTGNKPGGFDCSGLTSYAWLQAGVQIPRTSTLQYQGLAKKSSAELLPGDIVWHPGHVSMYLGVDQAIVDAPQTGKTVEVKKAGSRSWVSFLGPP